jgi:hypothetical protein
MVRFAPSWYALSLQMQQHPTVVAGIPIPSVSPVFVTVLAIHVLAGLVCVVAGLVAMFSPKRPGRHPRSGAVYYRSLCVVFASMAVLAALRWAEDYHLFVLGALSFAAAFVGRRAERLRAKGWVSLHISGMGLSYILLLTGFYVDNGRNLPLWRSLPPITYWTLPAIVGVPLIIRALLRHPVVLADRGRA